MLIDNFEVIEKFITFDEGTFYKFEALVRNTDGENSLYYEGISNTNKNILIKNWFIDNKEYYHKIKNEMKTLCDITGARLYITLDRKDTRKVFKELLKGIHELTLTALHQDFLSIKSLVKIISSKTSIKQSSDKKYKTIMFDVDIKDSSIYNAVISYVYHNNTTPYVLNTKKGWHIFCFKEFDYSNWEKFCQEKFNLYVKEINGEYKNITDFVSVKDNQLGLVYMNKD